MGAAAAGVFLVGEDNGRTLRGASTGGTEPLSGPQVRFAGTDVTTGERLGPGKLGGRPVVVTVWASWCEACAKQAEPLLRFASSHEETAFLAVDTQEDAEAARAFLEAGGLSIPTIADEDGHIAAKLGIRELPTTIFLTDEHRVAGRWEGPAGVGRLRAGLAAARAG